MGKSVSPKCEHPVMCRANKQCPNKAGFRIVVAGEVATLNMFGWTVAVVCGRHANSIASVRPGARLEPIVTEDSITDAQIREVWDGLDSFTCDHVLRAVDRHSTRAERRLRKNCRRRAADVWNARHGSRR